jgi:hypothetical protein
VWYRRSNAGASRCVLSTPGSRSAPPRCRRPLIAPPYGWPLTAPTLGRPYPYPRWRCSQRPATAVRGQFKHWSRQVCPVDSGSRFAPLGCPAAPDCPATWSVLPPTPAGGAVRGHRHMRNADRRLESTGVSYWLQLSICATRLPAAPDFLATGSALPPNPRRRCSEWPSTTRRQIKDWSRQVCPVGSGPRSAPLGCRRPLTASPLGGPYPLPPLAAQSEATDRRRDQIEYRSRQVCPVGSGSPPAPLGCRRPLVARPLDWPYPLRPQ